jgi:ABC-type molybdate transport system permease subunit
MKTVSIRMGIGCGAAMMVAAVWLSMAQRRGELRLYSLLLLLLVLQSCVTYLLLLAFSRVWFGYHYPHKFAMLARWPLQRSGLCHSWAP